MAMTPAMAEATAARDRIFLRWEEMKKARAGWESVWRLVGDFILPQRNMRAIDVPGSLVPYGHFDNTAQVANDRLAQTLYGHLVSPHTPFIVAELEDAEANNEEAVWLDLVARAMYRFISGAKSNFRLAVAEALLDETALGTTVVWTGAEPGAPPHHQALPLLKCWIDENEQGRVDTVYRAYELQRWRVREKYQIPEVEKRHEEKRPDSEDENFLQAVEPRRGHEGQWIEAKIHIETKRVVEARFYRSFPFSVARFMKMAGHAYGYSPGIKALPLAMGVSRLRQFARLGAEYDRLPPFMDFTGAALSGLDLRAGARNSIDPELYRAWSTDPIRPIPFGGSSGSTHQEIEALVAAIQYTFYVDWMTPAENGNETATAVMDKREIRFRAMGAMTARNEVELMDAMSVRLFELMERAGMFPPAPQSVRGRDIRFEYRSPISLAQRQGDVEALARSVDFTTAVAQIDPGAPQNFDWNEMVRLAAKGYGAPASVIRDREAVEREREEQKAAAQMSQQLEQAGLAAGAYRDAGQGEAALAGAMGGVQ